MRKALVARRGFSHSRRACAGISDVDVSAAKRHREDRSRERTYMPDASHAHRPVRQVRHLSPYLIPIVIGIIGIILICTIALLPIGVVILGVGIIWGAINGWRQSARARSTEPEPNFNPQDE